MGPSTGEKAPSRETRESPFKAFLARLRKRRIIETFAGFVAGGWLIYEIVHWVIVAHYHLSERLLDITIVTLLCALICVILWRWFRGTEKRPGNVKVEVLLVPLVILITLAIDLNLVLQIAGIPGKKLLIGIIAFLLGIAWIVFKSLQWASISQVALHKDASLPSDLSRPSAEPLSPSGKRPSIVVLPFENLSPDPENAFFTDGLTEEVIAELSQIGGLRVISRTTSVKLKGSTKDVREISRELNIQYALEGSVRKVGDSLRITAQLMLTH